jgi:C-terminal processing protease CtpA/Prc
MFIEQLLRVPSLAVGGRDLGPANFVERRDGTWPRMFGVDDAHGALAGDVLDRFRMLLDYERARVWLWPSGRAPDASASLTRVGVGLHYGADKCPSVTAISSGNAPDVAAALAKGDTILAVDGKSVCDGLHHTAATALAGRDGQPKKLQLRRAGKTSEVTVTVRDLTKP